MLVPMTEGDRFDFPPVFSKDRSRMVFVSIYKSDGKRAGDFGLFAMNKDGTDLRQLTEDKKLKLWPSFSSDNSRIVFAARGSGKHSEYDLYVIDADGGNLTQLTDDAATSDMYPVFLSNEEVLFSHSERYGHASPIAASRWHDHRLSIINIESGETSLLDDKKHYNLEFLSVAEYGELVFFSNSLNRIYVSATANPADRRWLTGPGVPNKKGTREAYRQSYLPQERMPLATPDGTALIRMAGGEFFRQDLETLEAIQLTDLGSVFVKKEYDPFSLIPTSIDPGGNRLLFTADQKPMVGRNPHELWMMNLDGTGLHEIEMRLE